MATPSPDVARPIGVMLLLGIALVHFLTLPHGFHIEAYLGVSLIIALGMASGGAVALLAEDSDRAWWYALAQGALNTAGWVLSRFNGLPLTDSDVAGNWFRATGLALAFTGLALTGLAAWVLIDRRRTPPGRGLPVISAHQRELTGPRPPRRPAD